MPRLNARGGVITGGGQTWLDPAHDDRRVGQQLVNGQWRVCVDGVPVADRGCNFLAAGGGFWLAYTPGYGVFGADGLLLPGAALPAGLDGRGAASFDGAIAIADNTDNIGLTLLTANGEVTAHVPGARLTDKLCVVSKTQALWIDTNGEPQTVGLPKPLMLPGQKLWPRVLIINGERWICYHSDDALGVVLHPFDSFDGYQIALPPAFYLDAVALGNLARIVWALDAGEGRIDVHDIDVTTQPRVRLGNAPPPPPKLEPPKPEPKPEPEPPVSTVPDRTADVAAFLAPRLRRIEGDEEATRAISFEAVNACCVELRKTDVRWGVLLKAGGPRDRAADVLLYDLHNGTALVVDVIGDAEGHDGTPSPAWSEKDARPIAQWRTPYPVSAEPQPVPNPGTPVPNPGTPPPAPSVDLSAVLARLDAIERRIDAGHADTRAQVLALAEAIEVLRNRPVPVPSVVFPDYTNRIIGTMRPVK